MKYADKWTTLLLTQDEGESPIYENGCIKALEEWFEKNYFAINLIIFITIAVQVLKLKFAESSVRLPIGMLLCRFDVFANRLFESGGKCCSRRKKEVIFAK